MKKKQRAQASEGNAENNLLNTSKWEATSIFASVRINAFVAERFSPP
jgi:hypothetical protein